MLIPLSLLFTAVAQAPTVDVKPLVYQNAVADKNFYLLGLIDRDPQLRQIIAKDSVLAAITQRRHEAVSAGFKNTNFGKLGALETIQFTSEEVDGVAQELGLLYDRESAIRKLADQTMPKSGAYFVHRSLNGKALLVEAWREAASGMNSIVQVYGLQSRPTRSPMIDLPLYDAKTYTLYGGLIKTIFGYLEETANEQTLFFHTNRTLAVELLRAHNRDEAGRHEPMEQSVNRAAYRQIAKTDFSKYPYSVIMVPGLGPENTVVRVSAVPRLLLSVITKRWREHKAPFIFVTGGYCYPNRTVYSEAIEMKRTLMEDYGVPESAIVVDPHARHTTTNIRNCVRLMFRYGVPIEKTGLIFTNTYQADDIVAEAFRRRCQGVFGFQPATDYRRIAPFEVEFKPNLDSLTLDPADPLDP